MILALLCLGFLNSTSDGTTVQLKHILKFLSVCCFFIFQEKDDSEENTAVKEKSVDVQSTTSADKTEESHLMHISSSSPRSGVKLSGTLKLMKPFTVQKTSSHKKLMDEFEDDYDFNSSNCFPRVLAAIWSTIFD